MRLPYTGGFIGMTPYIEDDTITAILMIQEDKQKTWHLPGFI
jgi:hypothetical protein